MSYALFMEKFPKLALLISGVTPKKPVDEQLSSYECEKTEVVYCYGLGDGRSFFSLTSWLNQNPSRQLIFLEDDPGIIASFLDSPHAIEVLSHERVFIELIQRKNEELEQLAKKFPKQRIDIIALPSYCNHRFKSLKLRLLRKTTLSFSLHVDRLHGHQIFENFVQALPYLSHSFYANKLQKAFNQTPAIVCGAGPSLEQSLPFLRQMENKALLIAGGSTIAALSSQGILPHFGMAVDPNHEEFLRLRNSFAFEMPLLFSTRVCPQVFNTCSGPFGYFRSGIGGLLELWLEEELGLLEPLVGDFLSAESISVTSICIAFAQYLGCNPILLNGIDLAYTNNRHYANGVCEKDVSLEKIDAEKSVLNRLLKKRDRHGKKVTTAVRWVMESACISYFAKKHPEIQFFNTTEEGIGFKGIEYKHLKHFVRKFNERDLRSEVYEKIATVPMPANTGSVIAEKIGQMRESLERCIAHLQVLAGEQKGSKALAELEMKEETAFLYLFFDMESVLKREFPNGPIWAQWLLIARKYAAILF